MKNPNVRRSYDVTCYIFDALESQEEKVNWMMPNRGG